MRVDCPLVNRLWTRGGRAAPNIENEHVAFSADTKNLTYGTYTHKHPLKGRQWLKSTTSWYLAYHNHIIDFSFNILMWLTSYKLTSVITCLFAYIMSQMMPVQTAGVSIKTHNQGVAQRLLPASLTLTRHILVEHQVSQKPFLIMRYTKHKQLWAYRYKDLMPSLLLNVLLFCYLESVKFQQPGPSIIKARPGPPEMVSHLHRCFIQGCSIDRAGNEDSHWLLFKVAASRSLDRGLSHPQSAY